MRYPQQDEGVWRARIAPGDLNLWVAKRRTRAHGDSCNKTARDYIKRVLEQTGWKVSGKNSAAEILGLERSTLRARMRKLNIRKP